MVSSLGDYRERATNFVKFLNFCLAPSKIYINNNTCLFLVLLLISLFFIILLPIVLFGQPSGATRKEGRPRLGCEDVINKDFKEMGTSWDGVKSLNRLAWRRNVYSCVGARRLQWVTSSSSLLQIYAVCFTKCQGIEILCLLFKREKDASLGPCFHTEAIQINLFM